MRTHRSVAFVVCVLFACLNIARADSVGTGFLVSSSGHVLTNYHVIKGCPDVRLSGTGSAVTEGHVLASDEQNDLAVIATGQKQTAAAQFRAEAAKVGESVWVYGFPLAGLLARTGNFTSGIVSALAGLGNDSRMLQISAPVQPGNSGGPLVDQTGSVVGIVVAKLDALAIAEKINDVPQNVNFAIKGSVAVDFLEANDVHANIGSSQKPLESVEIAERVKLFTVMVECESGGQRVAGIANGTEDQPSRADGGSLETRAASFIIEIERLSSGSSPSIVQKLASLYDNKVDYYGTSRSHDEVMTDKMRYFTRWPERRYSIIPGSLKVNCSSTTKFCDVTGAVEFSVDGMDRHSEGTATFAYGIAETSSGFRILSEAGNVITRHR